MKASFADRSEMTRRNLEAAAGRSKQYSYGRRKTWHSGIRDAILK